nr:MAG TPA: hypothetical protein [Microviridae sp.]
MEKYIIFYVNKNGLRGFVIIDAVDFKDAILVSKLLSKATGCEILGVCVDCFKSFKLDNNE